MILPELADTDFFDAGMFIGALDITDVRHSEAFPLVEDARLGRIAASTTTGILSEVYGQLTWSKANQPLNPQQAAFAIQTLVRSPSMIQILPDSLAVTLKTMELASTHNLTARRIHDAHHAAAALTAGVTTVYTYDADDWKLFAGDGLTIVGPASTLQRLAP